MRRKWSTRARLLHGVRVPLTHTLKSKDTLVIHMLCPFPCRTHPSLHIVSVVQFLVFPPTTGLVHSNPTILGNNCCCLLQAQVAQESDALGGTSVSGSIMMSGSLGIILWGLPTLGLHFSDQMRIVTHIPGTVCDRTVGIWGGKERSILMS